MKIGNPAEKPAAPPPAPTTSHGVNGQAASAATAAASHGASAIPQVADPSAKIELSTSASTLLDGSSSADFDAEKVARISKAIDDGTFKINPEAIADKLISNARDLLSGAAAQR